MQWTFVESLQNERQVVSVQEENWKLVDNILQQQAKYKLYTTLYYI